MCKKKKSYEQFSDSEDFELDADRNPNFEYEDLFHKE